MCGEQEERVHQREKECCCQRESQGCMRQKRKSYRAIQFPEKGRRRERSKGRKGEGRGRGGEGGRVVRLKRFWVRNERKEGGKIPFVDGYNKGSEKGKGGETSG